MSNPIIPPRDPSSHGIPSHGAKPLEPKEPGKFKEILEREEATKDF